MLITRCGMLKRSTIETLYECMETIEDAFADIGCVVENEISRGSSVESTDLAKLNTIEVRLSESAQLIMDLLERHYTNFNKKD